MKYAVQHLFLLLLLTTSWQLRAQYQSIEVLAVEYPPFTTITHPQGGLAFELLESAIPQRQWKPLFVPPKRAYASIDSGHWCASFYPANKTSDYFTVELSQQPIKIRLVRLSQTSSFGWTQLSELAGKSLALLRTGESSEFVQQFEDAEIPIVYVESVQAGLQMVLLNRVYMAMLDDISFAGLERDNKAKLQMSENTLLETPITLFVNKACLDDLPKITTSNK
ncbi:transporter substrate-binding domain-containing protein [Bowmanella sp. Y26]|uniref:transporter substrate-binding domain-containing protein n=1 Tax=Bowmanella yangjiangensis TaxID=2811230 RepID=UPI001BDBC1C2|nr:transporter substrate-binding domain-containing protein [Bowmanella yangjiangensis]MBT1064588.1 transporter substrate-binding domain-containing protein [Bowmanella yangjiangensis]